jgi:hypothetical protein
MPDWAIGADDDESQTQNNPCDETFQMNTRMSNSDCRNSSYAQKSIFSLRKGPFYTVIHFHLKLREILRFPLNWSFVRNFVFFGTSEFSVARNPGIQPEVSVGRFENTKFRVENPKLRDEILKFWNENPKFQEWQHEVSGKIQHIETSVIFFFWSASVAKNRNF